MGTDPKGDAGEGREAQQVLTAVSVCFFLSGATGLVYEVLWARMLGLVFGHTVFAITTVLAAFMAGLGLGSYLFGRLADRQTRHLRLYGLLEGGIGLYALLTPFLFSRAELLSISFHRTHAPSFSSFSLSQFTLIFLILLIPTLLMGATLPVLSRFFTREFHALGKTIGNLYALNTFGAVLGTYAAGFHLIPVFGIKTTLYLAAIVNLGIGLLALVFDQHWARLGLQTPNSGPQTPGPGLLSNVWRLRSDRVAILLTLVGFALSGAASMIYEVAWTRALALVIGSSTYAFSTMLVAFLAGLALGSAFFARHSWRLRIDPLAFALIELGIGLSALAVMPLFERMPQLFLGAFWVSQSPGFVKFLQFAFSVLAMILPTFLMGATFPCVAQVVTQGLHRVGHDVGKVYCFNTTGAIVGTVLAGFFLIPTIGLQATLKAATSLNLAIALVILIAPRKRRWWKAPLTLGPVLGFIALYAAPPWDTTTMSSGVAVYAPQYLNALGKVNFRDYLGSKGQLLFYRDGISATITVHRHGQHLFLKINGKTDASNGTDMHTQLMSGHLPLLLHPHPERALVIGLGSGVTAGAMALHPVQRIDVVEIEPAVVQAAEFFAKENRQVLGNPKVRMTVADGRNFILRTQETYDVITSEPSNPWISGVANLFALEFYRLAASRLAPNGIMCQWIHGYSLFPHDLRMVVKTFRSVFPHTTIWNTLLGDYLLIGSKEPISLSYQRLQSRYDAIPGLQEDFKRLGFRAPMAILADLLLGEEEAAMYAQNAQLNTDDLPLLEFSAPDSLHAETAALNFEMMKAFNRAKPPPLTDLPTNLFRSPQYWHDLGLAFLEKGMPGEARAQFERALSLSPRHADSLLQRGRINLRQGFILRAEHDFKAALKNSPGMAEAHEALGQLYQAQRMWDLAEAHLKKALALKPDPRYRTLLADLYRESGRSSEAIVHYQAALKSRPSDENLLFSLGMAYQGAGRPREAIEAFQTALLSGYGTPVLYHRLGLAYLALGLSDEAISAFQEAAHRDPLRLEPYLELGKLHAARREDARAMDAFQTVLRLDPSNARALRAVEELLAASEGASR